MTTIALLASDLHQLTPDLAFLGMPRGAIWHTAQMANYLPQAEQVTTITTSTAHDSADYVITIENADGTVTSTVTYTSDTTGTTAEISAGILAAIQEDPIFGQLVAADATSSTVNTLTGIWPGMAFSISVASSDNPSDLAVSTTTSAAAAEAVAFGRAVIGLSADGAMDCGGLPKSTRLGSKVVTVTVAYAANEKYLIDLECKGIKRQVSVDADTDHDTTTTAIVAAINAQVPTYYVLAEKVNATSFTLTAEVPGQTFTYSMGTKTGTLARLSPADTTDTAICDIFRVLRGVTQRYEGLEVASIGAMSTGYAANDVMSVQTEGEIWVYTEETITYGDKVYIETSGASAGLFYNTSGNTKILWPGARWIAGAGNSQNLGLISFPRL